MDIIYTLISLSALVIFAIFFSFKCKIPDAIAPLVAVAFTMLYLLAVGVFNILFIGTILYFILAIIILIFIITKKIKLPKFSVYFYAFIIISVAMIIFFGIRKPLLSSWDEFSFWGTAVKMMKLNHSLPATAEIGWAWVASQKAGLIVLGYFFEFIGEYSQWRIFVGINIVAISVFIALLTPFKKNKSFIAVPLLIIAYLSSYIFTIYRPLIEPSDIYRLAIADIPMGWFFCAAISVYYILKIEKAKLWPIPIILTALLMIKDTALPFTLIAWGIISFDILFLNKEITFFNISGIKAKISHILLNFSVIILGFLAWSKYIQNITGADPFGDIGGEEQMSMAGMLIEGVKQLFGIDRTQEFSDIFNMMVSAFFNIDMTMIGSCFLVMMIIIIILIIASVSTNDKEFRNSCIFFNILSVLGFFAYYTFLGFTYVFIFKSDVNTSLVGYERYVYPYLIGWFIISVMLLSVSILKAKQKFIILPTTALILILAVFIFRYNQYVPIGMSYLDYHDGFLHEREELVENAEKMIDVLGEDENGKIYFISQGDNGNRWFQYSADLLPLQLEYSFGGGTMVLPNKADGTYDYELSIEEFKDYLIENNCEFIFIERSDDDFINSYNELFSDNLEKSKEGESVLYKIVDDNNDITFEFLSII